MNGARTFFDTNVLLYMYSHADPRKQALAGALFREHAASGNLFLSTQVVQEFYAAGSRKMGLPRTALRAAVALLLELPIVTVTPTHILTALEMEERHRISFWDALIVSAATSCGAATLYTEDLADGQRYGPLVVRNPFAQ
jgi:predicted nucleic acid-binding protein